jgi:hypothetical protein
VVDASIARVHANQAQMADDYANNAGRKVWKTVTIHEFPSGVEVFLDESYETWSELGDAPDLPEKSDRGDGDRDLSIKRAARRAKTQVRRRAKMIQADCMLTLTYRENIQDKKVVEAHFKAFRKRLATLGSFPYVATLERQARGAYHVHIACQQFPAYLRDEHGVRVKSWNLIRSMWLRVVGRGNGNVDFTRPRGRNSAHRIASYIAKYVMKNVGEGELNAKSYWSSRDIVLPKPERVFYPGDISTFDLVVMIAKQFIARGLTDIAQYSDRLNAFHWFAASRPA